MGGSAPGNTRRAANSGRNADAGIFRGDWTFPGWNFAGAGHREGHRTDYDPAESSDGCVKTLGGPLCPLNGGDLFFSRPAARQDILKRFRRSSYEMRLPRQKGRTLWLPRQSILPAIISPVFLTN